MATTPTKTVQTTLLAWQTLALNTQVISNTFNCSSIWSAAIGISIVRSSGTAFTAGWPNIRIEASKKQSPDNASWIPLFVYQPAVGSSIANTTLNGAVSANAANFVLAANTNVAIGDLLFLGDAANANFEICRVKSISTNTITPEQNVVNAHANSSQVTDQAEIAFPSVDLKEYVQLRAVADNAGNGVGIGVEVTLTTFDSF